MDLSRTQCCNEKVSPENETQETKKTWVEAKEINQGSDLELADKIGFFLALIFENINVFKTANKFAVKLNPLWLCLCFLNKLHKGNLAT